MALQKKKITIFTGAGISVESGLHTFRGDGGLWNGHDVMKVSSLEGWDKDKSFVLNFYNELRKTMLSSEPNQGHLALVELEELYDVTIITQNVDNLHERAGSAKVLHLHGEILKARSESDEKYIIPWEKDITIGDCDNNGNQLRPHIVWFGEDVPFIHTASVLTYDADIFVVIGTSLNVYPAANLLARMNKTAKMYYIDPNPNEMTLNSIKAMQIYRDVTIITEKATIGVPQMVKELTNGEIPLS